MLRLTTKAASSANRFENVPSRVLVTVLFCTVSLLWVFGSGSAVASDAAYVQADSDAKHRLQNAGDWPWRRWHRARIEPRFEYRQVIRVGQHRRARRFEGHTRYRYVTRRASWRRAHVDIVIEGIDVYRRGRYLGTVDRLPRGIRRTRARIWRGGRVALDRDVALIGKPRRGYEILALEPSRGHYRPRVLRAAVVRLRRGEAVPIRRSRLIRAHRHQRLAPIPLLPDDIGIFDDRHAAFRSFDYRSPFHGSTSARSSHRPGSRYKYGVHHRVEHNRRPDRDRRRPDVRRRRQDRRDLSARNRRSERAIEHGGERRGRTKDETFEQKTSDANDNNMSVRSRARTSGRNENGRERKDEAVGHSVRRTRTDTIKTEDRTIEVNRETELRRLDDGRSAARERSDQDAGADRRTGRDR